MTNPAPTKRRALVIIGASAFAEVAYEYFTHDSDYEVKCFAVERQFRDRDTLLGLEVVALEDLEQRHPPGDADVYVAVVYTAMNRLRTRLLEIARAKGYKPASYISSRATVWPNAKLGEHVFVMEHNNVQPFVTLGSNCVLWSGNHVGHHSTIEDNCFVSSHVVISGFCRVGRNCFLGVNSAVANNVAVGEDNWIGPGVTVSKDTGAAEIYKLDPAIPSKVSSLRFFKVRHEVG